MKKVILITALLMSYLGGFSQSNEAKPESRMKYGINIGVNQSNLMGNSEGFPTNAAISNGLGFQLGILANYRITDMLSFSVKSALAFNDSKVVFTNTDNSKTEYLVMPIHIEATGHLVFKKKTGNIRPYFFFGPNFKLPIEGEPTTSTEFGTNSDFALDFGIGLEKAFKQFDFAPELRYSYGFLDVNQQPSIPSLRFHNISFIFNFMG